MLDTIILESSENTNKSDDGFVTYQIKPLIYGNYNIDQWFVFLSNITHGIDEVVFAIVGNKSNIKLLVSIPVKFQTYFETIFYSSYDFVQLEHSDYKLSSKSSQYVHFEKEPEIKSVQDFSTKENYTDHFKDIVSIFYKIPENSKLSIVYQIQKYHNKSKKKPLEYIRNFMFGAKKEVKENNLWFRIGYDLNSFDKVLQENIKNTIRSVFTLWTNGTEIDIFHYPYSLDLSIDEMTNFFHIPTRPNPSKGLEYSYYKQLPYPSDIEHNDDNSLNIGKIFFRDDVIDAKIGLEDISKHIYIVGKTGTGNSTLISQMFAQSIDLDTGVCLIDPHGDLANHCIDQIPTAKINNTVVFDVSDTDFPIGLNLLENTNEEEKNLIASGIISVFYKIFSYSRGPRLEYILRNAILSVIEYPKSTLLDVFNILIDSKFRKKVVENLSDNIVKRFRTNEFELWTEKQKQEAIGPITNKIGQLLSSNIVRNIFGQPNNKIDIAKIMNNGQILIVNLSKGKVGEDVASLIGGLLVTKLQIEALKRANIDYTHRKPFHIYIDEFQNFATDSFEVMLSESRKYKIGLILANQYISQLSPNIKQSVFGNVGSIVSFGLGFEDAQYMSNQFKNFVSSNDFLSLPNYTAYTKFAIGNTTSEPFCIRLADNIDTVKGGNTSKVIEQSRQRYAITRQEAETLIITNDILKSGNVDKKQILVNDKFDVESAQKKDTKIEAIQPTIKVDGLSKNVAVDLVSTDDNTNVTQPKHSGFSPDIRPIEVGLIVTGNVKFKYNYGIFVTYGDLDGLLHKNDIPSDVNWKKYYTEGDPITVSLAGFKDINGEQKAIWTQKFV